MSQEGRAGRAPLAGHRNLYALAPGALAPLQQWLTGVWDTALGSFAQFVDDSTDDRERNRP